MVEILKFIAVDNPASGIVRHMDRSRPVPTNIYIFSCFDCDSTIMTVYMKMNDIKNNCSNYCRGLATTKELMNPEKGRARFRIRSTMPLLVIGKYHLDTNTFSCFDCDLTSHEGLYENNQFRK